MKTILLILMIFISPAHAEIFKCIGEGGVVKYSGAPCNGGAQVAITASPDSKSKKAKVYPGYNSEKYLSFSKEKRNEICNIKKKAYEKIISSKCLNALDIKTKEVTCLSGEKFESEIEIAKKDYEFACQIQ